MLKLLCRLTGMLSMFPGLLSFNVFGLGFGFLASKEVKDAGVGNIGLQDRKPLLSDLICVFLKFV